MSAPAEASAGCPRNVLTPHSVAMRCGIANDWWGKDATRGRIRNIHVDGLHIHGPALPPVELFGDSAGHDVCGVFFSNVTHNGKPLRTLEELCVQANEFVSGVEMRGAKSE